MTKGKLEGMIAATFSPLKANGEVDGDRVQFIVEKLIGYGMNGIFICGSTGEGPSLKNGERKELAEAFVHAVDKRINVLVHVGHNSIEDARDLAAHAEKIGADFISATPPSYFKIKSVPVLVDCLALISSGAPSLPFYYYNIPGLTGVSLDMVELLEQAQSMPNFAGIKYTTPLIHEYQACLNFKNSQFDVLYGTDEMLLSAIAVGARGYIGSTYNFAAPLYHKIIGSFNEGDLSTARDKQLTAVRMVRIINKYGGLPAQKAMMKLVGMDCGPVRFPLKALTAKETAALEKDLKQVGFFEEVCVA